MNFSKYLLPALLVFSCLVFSNFAYGESDTDFSNGGGRLSGTSAGLALTGSTLISVTGYPGVGSVSGNLGGVSFTTGALASGSLRTGGTFATAGTFTIDGNGTGGLANGVLFSGTFSGPLSWTVTTLANGTHNYALTGVVTGTMGAVNVNGVTVQLTVNTGKGLFNGSTRISGGDTTVTPSVPEPSTLAMFGTGALGLVGLWRRRTLARI